MTLFPRRPCVQLVLGLALLCCSQSGLARPAPRYVVPGQEKPVALLTADPATYLVTEHSVFELVGRQFVRRYQSAAPIQCALAADTALWLGTRQGAVTLDKRLFGAHPLALPGVPGPASVTALCRDARGAIWVGAAGYGVFRLAGGPVEKALSLPTVSTALATADSAVWIGSSLGLSRFQHQRWTRYNEEGVANYEILDNLVDKLLPDNQGNLWVLMSAGISVFPGPGQAAPTAELPTATFIGKPGNEVFSVLYVPGVGRVFATAMGLLLLPDAPAGQFASFEAASTDKIEPKRALLPLTLAGLAPANPPRLLLLDRQQRVWLVSAGDVRVLKLKEFRRRLASAAGKGTS